jgi:hypothetical protein
MLMENVFSAHLVKYNVFVFADVYNICSLS